MEQKKNKLQFQKLMNCDLETFWISNITVLPFSAAFLTMTSVLSDLFPM